jgi:hypothetical protein
VSDTYRRCDEGREPLFWPLPVTWPRRVQDRGAKGQTYTKYMKIHKIYRIEATARQWMPCIVGPFRSSLLSQDSVQDTLAKPNEGTKACQQTLSVQSTRSPITDERGRRTAQLWPTVSQRKRKKERKSRPSSVFYVEYVFANV